MARTARNLARRPIWQLSRAAGSSLTAQPAAPTAALACGRAAAAAALPQLLQRLPGSAAPFAASACSSQQASSAAADAVNRNLLLDTLDLMRRFERLGMSRRQAEALTASVTEVICQNRDKLADTYVSKGVLEKAVLEQEARISGFRSEVLKSQELQVAAFTRDIERLQSNLEKIRSEIRYEVDKLTASQRLDLNLEKGRMRDELQMLRDKANELEIKVDKEVNSLRAAMEQSKNDTVKYVLGLILALITAGLGVARIIL